MPKLKNVTEAEIQGAIDATEGPISQMLDFVNRMNGGYCDDIADPMAAIRHFNAVARSASDLVAALLFRTAMQQREAEIAVLLKQKAEQEGK